ncbi:ATP-dependent Clp protease proteolytic subunit [Acinetobacter sp.]|uniref:ATP-dependent Clp protease proteolytic subunit n=1 Tax=Acinetobacter sp. TaxID=472 RepID=UPI003CFDF103
MILEEQFLPAIISHGDDQRTPPVFVLSSDIEESAVLELAEVLSRLEPDDTLTVYINCLGGDLTSSVSMYHLISSLPNHTRAINLGKVYSGAVLPFMACKERLCLPNGHFLIHRAKGSLGFHMDQQEVVLTTEYFTELEKQYRDVLVASFGSKRLVNKMLQSETYVFAKEALTLGIIDKVTERLL